MHLKSWFRTLPTQPTRVIIFFLIILNILLKFPFLFMDVYPSDVDFYRSTGEFWIYNQLPYQVFSLSSTLEWGFINALHPNGPFNYLFYSGWITIFGDSIFAIKLPWLIAECVIAVSLFKIATKLVTKQKAFLISIIYSLTLTCYFPGIFLGCDELITGAMALTSLYFFIEKRFSLSAVLLSIGVAYKLYPVFFLIPFTFYFLSLRDYREFLKFVILFLLVYLSISFPFLIFDLEGFMQYNFGQATRFITISFGKYISDSWFFQSWTTVDLGIFSLPITPHLIFELLWVGGYILWDFNKLLNHQSYEIKDVLLAINYFIGILPIISLSYNYRYFQWQLPIFLLVLFQRNQMKQKTQKTHLTTFNSENQESMGYIEENRYNIYTITLRNNVINSSLIYLVFTNLIIMVIFSGDYIVQMNTQVSETLFGVIFYNNYHISFSLAYSIFLMVWLRFFCKDRFLRNLGFYLWLEGILGIVWYAAHEAWIFGWDSFLIKVIFGLILLFAARIYLFYLVLNKNNVKNTN